MFSLKEESKAIKVVLLASCIIFFSSILISIFYYGNSTLLGNFYSPNNDDVKFIRSAWNLVQTGNYSFHRPPEATVFMMPGLPFTLAFLMKLFGHYGGITALRILQAIFQVFSLLLVFFIGRKIFNSRVGIIAVILDILCISEIWVPNLVLTETFFKFFVLMLLLVSMYAIEQNKIKYYVLGGGFLGIATLFRPTIAPYPILIIIIWIIIKINLKDAVKYSLVVAGVFCLVMSPWWVRNYSIYHKFIPMTLASGNPMLQGTFIDYNQKTKATDGLDYTNYNTKAPKLTEIEKNDMEIALSKYRLKTLAPKTPLKFIYWYTIQKGWIQINSPFYWGNIFGEKFELAKLYYLFLLLIGLMGVIFYFKDKEKNKLAILPILTIVFFIIVYLPFYTMCRYFYPVVPLVIIFSSYFILKTFTTFKSFYEKRKIRKGAVA